MPRTLRDIDGNGDVNTCYHICIMSGRIRVQANAGDTFYLTNPKDAVKIGKWFLRAAKHIVVPKKKRPVQHLPDERGKK